MKMRIAGNFNAPKITLEITYDKVESARDRVITNG